MAPALFSLAAVTGIVGLTYLLLSALAPSSLYLLCGLASAENTPALRTTHGALGITGLLSSATLASAFLAPSGLLPLLGILLSWATAVNLIFMPGVRPFPLAGALLIVILSVWAFLRLESPEK